MKSAPIKSDLPWLDFMVLRLLRRWGAARSVGESSLPSMVELIGELGGPADAAVALHSVFQLTENCLGRPLQVECCCNRGTTADERAMIMLIGTAPLNGPTLTSPAVPHGLPSALCWAVASTRIMLGARSYSQTSPIAQCPFDRWKAAAPLGIRGND